MHVLLIYHTVCMVMLLVFVRERKLDSLALLVTSDLPMIS